MLLIKGIILGFLIAAPVGPIGLLCIKRSLQKGFLAGVSSGLGAAVADAFYAGLVAFGFTALTTFLTNMEKPVSLIGGGVIIILAVRVFNSGRAKELKISRRGLFGNFITTFFLTIMNPATIIGFAAIFAGLGLSIGNSFNDSAILVAGVFIGSMLWWIILSGFVVTVRPKGLTKNTGKINRIAGVLLGIFGIVIIASAIIN